MLVFLLFHYRIIFNDQLLPAFWFTVTHRNLKNLLVTDRSELIINSWNYCHWSSIYFSFCLAFSLLVSFIPSIFIVWVSVHSLCCLECTSHMYYSFCQNTTVLYPNTITHRYQAFNEDVIKLFGIMKSCGLYNYNPMQSKCLQNKCRQIFA